MWRLVLVADCFCLQKEINLGQVVVKRQITNIWHTNKQANDLCDVFYGDSGDICWQISIELPRQSAESEA